MCTRMLLARPRGRLRMVNFAHGKCLKQSKAEGVTAILGDGAGFSSVGRSDPAINSYVMIYLVCLGTTFIV